MDNCLTHACTLYIHVLNLLKDVVGGAFDPWQAFSGSIGQFDVWDKLLATADIKSMADCSVFTNEDTEVTRKYLLNVRTKVHCTF